MSDDHLSAADVALYCSTEPLLSPQARAAMAEHVYTCPACLERTDLYLEQAYPFPNDLEAREIIARAHRNGQVQPRPLRAAASTAGARASAQDVEALRPTPFVTIDDVEIRRLPHRPGWFMLVEPSFHGRSLQITGPDLVTLTCDADAFGRFALSAEDLSLLEGWMECGARLSCEVK